MSGDDSRMVKDPVCGKDVDTLRARAVAIFGGVTLRSTSTVTMAY